MSSVAASNASVLFENGEGVNLFRQRPKVKLNKENNAVVALFHGAMRCGERAVRGGKAPGSHCTGSHWPEVEQSSGAAGSAKGGPSVEIAADLGSDRSFTTVVPVRTHK